MGANLVELDDALTQRRGEAYAAWIERIGRNPAARKVKILELMGSVREKPKFRQALWRLVRLEVVDE